MLRYEIQNEIESLLTLFQCSRRGLRFLGVVFFHLLLLMSVTVIVTKIVDGTHRARKPPSEMPTAKLQSDSQQVGTAPLDSVEHYTKSDAKVLEQRSDQQGLSIIYKIWLVAILYALIYLTLESIVLQYVDLSLVEFINDVFLDSVARITGIDLSDYPAGEMYLNPLVRRRLR